MSRKKEADGRGANRSSAYDSTPAVSEGGARLSKTPVRGLTKGWTPDAVIPVANLTRTHGRNAGQTGSQAPAVPSVSFFRLGEAPREFLRLLAILALVTSIFVLASFI